MDNASEQKTICATARYARMSPTKIRPFARLLAGLSVEDALMATRRSHSKGMALIRKALKSAIANAENNGKMSADACKVESVIVEQGPVLKRFWARSRGMARPVHKRTSHVRVVLVKR